MLEIGVAVEVILWEVENTLSIRRKHRKGNESPRPPPNNACAVCNAGSKTA